MLVTPRIDQRNQRHAALISGTLTVGLIAMATLVSGWWWLALPVPLVAYRLVRRRTLRRRHLMQAEFPPVWEQTLLQYVAFYRMLHDEGKGRFRKLVQVFLDEVPITGIRTDVDEQTRALVAASAVIPVFRFDDWEYSGLGEILIYPNAFNHDYQTDGEDPNTLGMIGVGHLSGVLILSKPDLIAGFANPEDKRNVGIHEFAHLVDKADGSVDGIAAGIPASTVRPWIQWVADELKSGPDSKHINDYAYTNEAEYFAVLTEYFFEAPDILAKKNPELYQMLESIYRQETQHFLASARHRPHRVGRNQPCPCGSGKKFKKCCRRRRRSGAAKVKS